MRRAGGPGGWRGPPVLTFVDNGRNCRASVGSVIATSITRRRVRRRRGRTRLPIVASPISSASQAHSSQLGLFRLMPALPAGRHAAGQFILMPRRGSPPRGRFWRGRGRRGALDRRRRQGMGRSPTTGSFGDQGITRSRLDSTAIRTEVLFAGRFLRAMYMPFPFSRSRKSTNKFPWPCILNNGAARSSR